MNVALPYTFKDFKVFIAPLAYPYTDSVVVGIIFTCTVLLLLITLTVMVRYFIRKNATAKKGVSQVIS